MKIHDVNKSRETNGYWSFEKFNLESFDEGHCLTNFRIKKNIFCKIKYLELSENIVWVKKSVAYVSQYKNYI